MHDQMGSLAPGPQRLQLSLNLWDGPGFVDFVEDEASPIIILLCT